MLHPAIKQAIEALEKANTRLTAYGDNNTKWCFDAISALRELEVQPLPHPPSKKE